ncbi:M13 family metallopeptidase [Dysgonomonas sp. 25]|uniref:M13 family metallopeptidase n=1 Tax=Dysgonomonas sp. 25 TaxID=2302933 RepID=UPI0013D5FDC7|nr:M13 family metallopeptidase [Dysgonomonas sp. 25]NDV67297.1 M13 family peptidase [Dysgonomonas sp. 25]
MKKKYLYLPLALVVMTTFGFTMKDRNPSKNLDMTDLDTTATPGNDFYQYATGGWTAKNPMKDEYSRYGAFEQLAEVSTEQVKGLIEGLSGQSYEQGSVQQKIGDLYKVGMDTVKIEAEGAAPIKPQLDKIAAAANRADIIRLVGEVSQYAGNPFFGLYVGADDKNSSMNIVHLYQSGLSLGDREYYLKNDEASSKIRAGYENLIEKQFKNAGYSNEDAVRAMKAVMKIETALAKAHFTKEDKRIPEKNYHKMAVSDLNKKVANFDWNTYFETVGIKDLKDLNVSQIEPVAEAVRLLNTLPLDEVQYYLSWKVINSAASYLSDNFVNDNFDFYGKQLSGRQAMQPRWKRVVNTVNGSLSEAVGEMYVAKYFPPAAKERMLELVKNLQTTLGERVNNLTWMSDVTKEKAQEKLSTFTVKIGYPDKWKDYSPLEIKADESYWANNVRVSLFDWNEMIAKVGKPVDKAEWHMPPQMVNAYYNPATNEICFPAGILQPPFFYMDGDDAINYGAIGVVIGHEMSHGFDDQGSKFDKEGNLANWWTGEDEAKFKERAQVLVEHFNNIEVLPGLYANGVYTLGENIGDFGGLQIAYNAFEKTQQAKDEKKIDGFTPQQRFFLAYAKVWAGDIREAEIRRRTQTDPHSLGKWRVNGTLPHINAWYEAFNITSDDSLYIPKEERADIW